MSPLTHALVVIAATWYIFDLVTQWEARRRKRCRDKGRGVS